MERKQRLCRDRRLIAGSSGDSRVKFAIDQRNSKEAPMLQIAVINESTAMTDDDVQKMIPAFSQQWNSDLKPVWGVDDATFTFVPSGQQPAAGTWWMVFLDNSDQA